MITRLDLLNLSNEIIRDIDENIAFMLIIKHYLKNNKPVDKKCRRGIIKAFKLAEKSLNDLKYQVIPIISELKSDKIILEENLLDCFNELSGCKLDIKHYNKELIEVQSMYITGKSS